MNLDHLQPNKHGALVGIIAVGIDRVFAHTYRVASRSQPGTNHLVYVHTLRHARCSCPAFVIGGACGHVRVCRKIERTIRDTYPEAFREERRRQAARVRKGYKIIPYEV